jgi:hypothetical protein
VSRSAANSATSQSSQSIVVHDLKVENMGYLR